MCNASELFQEILERMLEGIKGVKVALDDVLVGGSTENLFTVEPPTRTSSKAIGRLEVLEDNNQPQIELNQTIDETASLTTLTK